MSQPSSLRRLDRGEQGAQLVVPLGYLQDEDEEGEPICKCDYSIKGSYVLLAILGVVSSVVTGFVFSAGPEVDIFNKSLLEMASAYILYLWVPCLVLITLVAGAHDAVCVPSKQLTNRRRRMNDWCVIHDKLATVKSCGLDMPWEGSQQYMKFVGEIIIAAGFLTLLAPLSIVTTDVLAAWILSFLVTTVFNLHLSLTRST